jgi:two-component system, sensor histidine kinase PdtaS
MESNFAECKMDTRQLYPLGIIIYELLTNAHKYAFLDKRKGEISVILKEQPADTLVLEVSDNGVGISQGVIDGTEEGFGFSLVKIFLRQLQGRMTINRENGTRIAVLFPR